MPSPVSLTVRTALPPWCSSVTVISAAGRRELDRVDDQVPDHLLEPIGIAQHRPRRVQGGVERDALRVRGGAQRVEGVLDQRRQVRRAQLEPQLAGDDPRHVEDVGDQLLLQPRVALDRFERARGALGVQFADAQEARPSEHGVQRRTELVRQRREKIFLRPMRDREVLGAPPEIVLQPLPLGDVANHQREAAQLARVVAKRREDDVRFEGMTAAPHPQPLRLEPALRLGGHELRRRCPFVAIRGQVERAEAAPDDLVARCSRTAARRRRSRW